MFADQLDGAIDARDRARERKQSEYANHRLLVENFVAEAVAALGLATEAINRRALDLQIDMPATVETKSNFHGTDSMSVTIMVSMTRPGSTDRRASLHGTRPRSGAPEEVAAHLR